jgi:cytochrome c oxidase cbb3-type subunit 4
MEQGIIGSVFTVVVFVSFLGVVWWVFKVRKKADFDAAANLIFDDENKQSNSKSERE